MSDMPKENAEMPYDPAGDDAATDRAMEKFERALMAIDGVEGVGLGTDEAGDDAVIVYVRDREVIERLPERIDGLLVVPEITGPIDAY